jgi:hypothetical protein
MTKDLCRCHYNLQYFDANDPGVPHSVLVNAEGSHRTTGYRTSLKPGPPVNGMPSFSLCHERNDQPDLQMMTQFVTSFAFASNVPVSKARIQDAHGVQIVPVQNLPTLIATCPA